MLSGFINRCNGAEGTLVSGIFCKYGHVPQEKGGPSAVPNPTLKQTNKQTTKDTKAASVS